jgi:hypothetical protein
MAAEPPFHGGPLHNAPHAQSALDSTAHEQKALCIPIEREQNSSNIPAVKFLGLYFDTELNFKYHIKMICTRVSRALYNLRTCKNFLPEKSLKILYYSMVHCHIVYGNHIWGCANDSLITELSRKQKAVFHIISNSSYKAL